MAWLLDTNILLRKSGYVLLHHHYAGFVLLVHPVPHGAQVGEFKIVVGHKPKRSKLDPI
jgi:hypothetical protein